MCITPNKSKTIPHYLSMGHTRYSFFMLSPGLLRKIYARSARFILERHAVRSNFQNPRPYIYSASLFKRHTEEIIHKHRLNV